jgi:protein ImuB
VEERWWEPDHHRRLARFQMVTDDGRAHLVVAEHRRWWISATYD